MNNKQIATLFKMASNLNQMGFKEEGMDVFFEATKYAFKKHPLNVVLAECGFCMNDCDSCGQDEADEINEIAEEPKNNKEIWISISKDGGIEYTYVNEKSESMDYDNFEELVSDVVEENHGNEEEEFDDENIKEAASKTKSKKKKKLNKPFRTPSGPKKFSVYVKNENGNTVKVNFGDPNMSIKKNNPKRKKSFRARHKCETPGPKTKARFWSCRNW